MFYTDLYQRAKRGMDSIYPTEIAGYGHVTQDGGKITFQLKYAKRVTSCFAKNLQKDVPVSIQAFENRRALAIMGDTL